LLINSFGSHQTRSNFANEFGHQAGTSVGPPELIAQFNCEEAVMGFGKGALLWLIGIPLPIILLLAIFMHH
jgi:hypothetical protein